MTAGNIGVFDSGVGGLTVVKELRRLMPAEDIVYFGDTARAPYGSKDALTLLSYGREIIRFLLNKNAKIIVMACGTSSSTSFEALCADFPAVPIVDTIRPAVAATLALAKERADFAPVFIATEATINSGLFARLYNEGFAKMRGASAATPDGSVPPREYSASDEWRDATARAEATLYTRACPLFAPMAEVGLEKNHPLLRFAAENYLADLRGKINALVLGCTHYPLLTDAITHALGDITYVNPATATAEATRDKLLETFGQNFAPSPSQNSVMGNNVPAQGFSANGASLAKSAKIEYYTSGNAKKFSEIAENIIGEPCCVARGTL